MEGDICWTFSENGLVQGTLDANGICVVGHALVSEEDLHPRIRSDLRRLRNTINKHKSETNGA